MWLACQLRLVDGNQAAALLAATCCPAALDVAHARSREQGLTALRCLLAALVALQEPLPPAGSDGAGEALLLRQSLHSEVATALEGVLTAVEVEARAVVKAKLGVSKSKRGSPAHPPQQDQDSEQAAQDPQAAALALMEVVAAVRSSLLARPERLAAALALLHPETRGCGEVPPASPSASPSPSVAVDLPLLGRVLSTADKVLNLSSAAAQPTGAEARRILGFFVTSLANRQMAKPSPVATMSSWTVLTPLYAEDVLFPLEAHTAAEALGLAPPPAAAKSNPVACLPDLLTETEERVSLMAYIRSMFPKGQLLGQLQRATGRQPGRCGPACRHRGRLRGGRPAGGARARAAAVGVVPRPAAGAHRPRHGGVRQGAACAGGA